jgi:hypothetical protein
MNLNIRNVPHFIMLFALSDFQHLRIMPYKKRKKTTKLRGFSSEANYTDRAIAACRRS